MVKIDGEWMAAKVQNFQYDGWVVEDIKLVDESEKCMRAGWCEKCNEVHPCPVIAESEEECEHEKQGVPDCLLCKPSKIRRLGELSKYTDLSILELKHAINKLIDYINKE